MELVNLSIVLISLGIFFMLLAVLKTQRILISIKGKTEIDSWRILFFMMIFFLAGYCAALYLILVGDQKMIAVLTGMIFLLGAVFVFIITRVSSVTINTLILKDKTGELNQELKKNEISLKQQSGILQVTYKELEDERKQLENRIEDRTFEIKSVNIKLKNEIEEHKKSEQALSENKIRLQKLNEELDERVKIRTAELVKAQESLLISEEKYRKIMNEVGDCVYTIDDLGIVTYINSTCKRFTGFSEDELIGKTYLEIVDSEWREKVVNFYKAQFNDKIPETLFSFPIITKSHEKKWVEQIVTRQKDGKKNTGYNAIVRDISQRKIDQEKLKQKSEELERSNKELEQFAYVASHDLQEPLRMVSSYLQLLEKRYKDKLDKDANEFIHFAVDGSNRMRNLIMALLEYSRVNRIKEFEFINVNEILNEVLGDLKASITESKAIIKIESLPDIFGDKVLIGQLFQNLLSNALKFKGDRNPEILISGKKTTDEFLFSVKDNGIGIQKEYASKLFIIFQRLNIKEQYPGTGIGLAICKKIVEKHGGKIWFESDFGIGTTFYFTIKEKVKTPKEEPKETTRKEEVQKEKS